MVASGVKQLEPPRDFIVFIENVGNLVCPALFKRFALSVNPRIKIFEVSALSGEGMEAWYEWIKEQTAR